MPAVCSARFQTIVPTRRSAFRPPHDTLLHQAQRAMDMATDAAVAHSSRGQLAQTSVPLSETQDDNPSPLPYSPTPRPYEALRANQAADDEEQITNIVFNETRALSGSGIDEARKKMALTIMNAVERWPGPGNARFRNASTAPNALPEYLPPKEQAILEDVRTVREAGILRSLGGDEVDGATNYYLPKFEQDNVPSIQAPPWGRRLINQSILGPFPDSYEGGQKYIYIWLSPPAPERKR
jgi:hypothetical protein